jgi:EmrB/QacA subfamily drug resistance transporter
MSAIAAIPVATPDDRRPAAATLVLASLGVSMTALDTLVVTTALPVLRVDLHAGLSGLEWTVNAYNLAFACLLLTGAALGDRFGRRRVFVAGLAVFTAASAAAALSGSIGVLVGARVVQGAAAAIVMPLSLTLISSAFPPERRAVAIGLWGGIVGGAVAVGPLVGGAVVAGLGWQWMFWLNVPVGLAVVPLAARRLTESFGPRSRLDLPGLVLACAGVLGLTWGLVHASSAGWVSPTVAGPIAAGAVVLAGFVAWEHRTASPMLPLGLFRSRVFAAANGVSFFMYAGLFGALFLMSQLLQTALGYTPLEAGLRLLPWTASPMVIAPLAGTLAQRYGNRPLMTAGLALQAAGYAWIAAAAGAGMSYLQLGMAFAVAGVGTSLCFPSVAAAVMGSVPMTEAGVASGANSAFRELGGVFGVAVLSTVFTRPGIYTHPVTFIHGFQAALWVAVALSAAGVAAAVFTATRRSAADAAAADPAEAEPALAA